MSYLENGSTHRSLFRLMGPLHHDADPNRSQVLAHIMQNTGWDLGRAMRAFNSMRHPKSKVLVFDQVHRMWKGCDWVPSDEDSKSNMFIVELRRIERRVIAMDSELNKATKEIKRLNKKLADFLETDEESDESDERPKRRKDQSEYAANIEAMVKQAWS